VSSRASSPECRDGSTWREGPAPEVGVPSRWLCVYGARIRLMARSEVTRSMGADARLPALRRSKVSDVVEIGLLGVLVVLARGVPRWVLGEDSFVTIHDNLDSDFMYRVLIGKPGRLFDYDGIIPEVMGGLPRWTFPSGAKLSSLIFHWFEPFTAYCLLEQIVSLGAAGGMWLLLKDYALGPRWGRSAIAFCFALLPYYFVYDLTVAGQALVLWALLNAWHGKNRVVSWSVCALFPFCSVLQMAGLFVVASAFLGLGAAAVWHRRSRPIRTLIWPLACAGTLGTGYLAADYGFLSRYLLGDFVSHRSVYSARGPVAFRVSDFTDLLLHGRYHAASHHEPILALAVVAVGVSIFRGNRRHAWRIVMLVGLSVLIALSQQYLGLPGVSELVGVVPTLGQITPRFWWSFPTLWFLVWGLIVASWPRSRLWQLALGAFAVVQLLNVGMNLWGKMPELGTNYALLSARDQKARRSLGVATFRQFTSKHAVRAIREYVGTGRGHYLCLGFHPSVLQIEGLPTADGYRDLYPLSYKLRFRPLIEAELVLDRDNAKYFDNYGGRAYYFVPGVSRRQFSSRPFAERNPHEIHMNIKAARDLDVRWVVSTFKMTGPATKFLEFERTFKERGGFTFHLYRVHWH
jgi:YHS domain-containing protein